MPIIILTIAEDKDRGYRLGVDRYLNKPVGAGIPRREIEALLKPSAAVGTVLIADANQETLRQLREVPAV